MYDEKSNRVFFDRSVGVLCFFGPGPLLSRIVLRKEDGDHCGRTYELPGGTLSLDSSDSSREALLRALRTQRDLWRPNNEAGLIAYAEAMKK